MSNAERQILERLSSLYRYERRRALLSSVFLALSGVAVAISVGSGVATLYQSKLASAVSAGLLLAVSLFYMASWLIVSMRRSRSATSQASCVEDVYPAFRMRLITVTERLTGETRGPLGHESPAIFSHIVDKVLRVMPSVESRMVHPLSMLVPSALVLMGSLAPLAVATLYGEPAPHELYSWLSESEVVEELSEQPVPIEDAVVGEISFVYVYPEYTGLPPLEVPNSNGTAHGPPGTEVLINARTGEPVASAVVVVNENAPESVSIIDGRDLSASITLVEDGFWRFRFKSSIEQDGYDLQSSEYLIEIDPDLPPIVNIESNSDRLEVELTQQIPISWDATDDFGISRIVVRIGDEEVVLREGLGGQRQVGGPLGKTPEQLGLSPGDEVVLVVEGWDNDEFSGSKAGQSQEIRLKVLGPVASARRVRRLWRELRDALVDMLAGYVTDPSPPSVTESGLSVWAADAAGRLEPVDALMEQYWDAFQDGSIEALVTSEVRRLNGTMLRFAATISDPRSEERIVAEDMASLVAMRDELVDRTEHGVLMLDQMVRYSALGRLDALARILGESGDSLQQRIEAGVNPLELAGRLDMVERQLDDLMDAAQDYGRSSLTDFLERSAEDANRLVERTRDSLADDNAEEYGQWGEELADSLQMISEGVDHMQSEMEQSQAEMEDMLQQLRDELERLETEERLLASETAELASGDESIDGADAWERALALTESAYDSLTNASDIGGDLSGLGSRTLANLETLSLQVGRMIQVVQARDLLSAQTDAARSSLMAARLQRTLSRSGGGKGPSGALTQENLSSVLSGVEDSQRDLNELVDLLQSLDRSYNRSSPESIEAGRGLVPIQENIRSETEAVRGLALSMAEQLPMGAPGLEESIDSAILEMRRGERALNIGRTLEAVGAEEAAADRLRQAREALDQAAAAMAQMQSAMEGGGSGYGSGDGRGGEEDADEAPMTIELPTPEEFQTPEEYRRALLLGMQGDVPAEYEALKRRYYEDLVSQ